MLLSEGVHRRLIIEAKMFIEVRTERCQACRIHVLLSELAFRLQPGRLNFRLMFSCHTLPLEFGFGLQEFNFHGILFASET